MGRKPIGKVAMSTSERQRRYLDKLRGAPAPADAGKQVAQLKARIAELERRGEGAGPQLTRSRHDSRRESGAEYFSEAGTLRRQILGLKSDINKLKSALQEEPDTAKLRTQVVEQKQTIAQLRQQVRKLAKERDHYQAEDRRHTTKKFREGRDLTTPTTYRTIVKALHSDRAKHVTAAELAEAERLFITLKPLFE
jgi:hypothetical protein